jgi:small-conductance mechanosensitive channel
MALSKELAAGLFGIETDEDLEQARRILRQRADDLARRAASSYEVGDPVSFKLRDGVRIHGTVVKVNEKTVTVKHDESPAQWRVSPCFLERRQG